MPRSLLQWRGSIFDPGTRETIYRIKDDPAATEAALAAGGAYRNAGHDTRVIQGWLGRTRGEVAPGFGTKGLSGGGGCSVMVDGADDEETETEVRCRREGEDSA
jgi:hypothetical protein